MSSNTPSYAKLLKEIAELRARLGEAEPTVNAIRAGEVDAFVIQGLETEKVVLLQGADSPYRLLMEEMEQGAFTMTSAGQVLYCNQRLAALLRTSPEHITGTLLQSFIRPAEQPRLKALLRQAMLGSAKGEMILRAADGTEMPARLACSLLTREEMPILAGLVTDLTERKHLEAQLEHTAEQLRKLTAHLQVVREEERTRIAREIHDELGAALTVFKMDLAQFRKLVPKTNQKLQAKLGAFFKSVDSLMEAVHRIAMELRPAILDHLGLLAAIEWQLEDFQTHSGIRCVLSSNEGHIELDPERGTTVFRVFQEALTNVVRHAQATQVEVRLERQDGYLVLQVRDNGRGIAEHDKGAQSLGLLGMRERIHLLSGEFDIHGFSGQGTTVQIRIPVERPNSK